MTTDDLELIKLLGDQIASLKKMIDSNSELINNLQSQINILDQKVEFYETRR